MEFRSRFTDVATDCERATIKEGWQRFAESLSKRRCELRTCNPTNIVGLERLKRPIAHGASTGTLFKVTPIEC